jgi:hypothetical protein
VLSQTLDDAATKKGFSTFFHSPASRGQKEKNFSLICQSSARITSKTVTTYIPKSLQIHRSSIFLPDTSVYVTNNLRGDSQRTFVPYRFGTRFA